MRLPQFTKAAPSEPGDHSPWAAASAAAGETCQEGNASGPLVSDAALTALAIENGAALASTDRDFSRFRGLQWVHPFDS
jgi:predicted nucleic acid-binding protein